MARTPDGKVRWERPKPAPTPTEQGGLFAGVNMPTGTLHTTQPSTRENIATQLALPGFLGNTSKPKKQGSKRAPTSPAAEPPRTIFDTTGISEESIGTEEGKWLKIDLRMEARLGVTEECRQAIQSALDGAANEAKSSHILKFEDGSYFIRESDLPILEEQVRHHYSYDFELPISNNTVTFKPEIATTDKDAGRWAS